MFRGENGSQRERGRSAWRYRLQNHKRAGGGGGRELRGLDWVVFGKRRGIQDYTSRNNRAWTVLCVDARRFNSTYTFALNKLSVCACLAKRVPSPRSCGSCSPRDPLAVTKHNLDSPIKTHATPVTATADACFALLFEVYIYFFLLHTWLQTLILFG